MKQLIAFVGVLVLPCFSFADNQAAYAEGKALAQSSLQGPSSAHKADVPFYQGENVPETTYQENFHIMGNVATEKTHDPEDRVGPTLIQNQKEIHEQGFKFNKNSALIRHSNDIVKEPLAVICGEAEPDSGGERESIETTHLCEESAEPVTYTCEQTRIVTPKEVDEGELEVRFWYRPIDRQPLLNMNIITDTALNGNQWNQGGSPRAKDMSGGVYNPVPAALRDHITSIELKAPLTNPCGGGSMSFDDKGTFYYRGGCGDGYHHRTHVGTAIIKYRRTTENRYWRTHVYGQAIHRGHHHHGPSGYGHDESYNFYTYTPNKAGFNKGHFDGSGTYWWTEVPEYKDYDILIDDPDGDRIDNQCPSLELKANQGLCVYGSEEILEGPGEKTFTKGETTLTVTRDWWKRRRTYHCKYPSKDTCEGFRSAGCEQTKARCKVRIEGVCVAHEKIFLCRSQRLGNGVSKIGGDVPFCLDGNCDDHSWSANKDFAEAMSKMSVFREISKDMDAKNASVFRGEAMQCSKSAANFQDCCGSGGWGRSVGLGQDCKTKEKNLKKEREAQKCVMVGTYCEERDPLLKVCLRKKTSFCCFGSKLAKIVHEQGRAQIGLGWGDAKTPDCRPLTVDELQKIDFSKIDLSALYSEIRSKININTVTQAADGLGEGWQAKVSAGRTRRDKTPDDKISASELYKTEENPDASL